MKIKYYDESNKLITCTEDYIPNVGDFVTINNIIYEVVDEKSEIIALHTEFDVYLAERQHNVGI